MRLYSKNLFIGNSMILLICLALFSCKRDKNTGVPQISVELNDTTSRYISDIAQSVDYIPLEMTSESSIGQISRLELVDNYFVIFEDNLNAIFFFKNDGSYSHKISNKGLTPKDSYEKISDFSVNRKEKRILIRDSYRNKIVIYNYLGKKISENDWSFSFLETNSTLGATVFYKGNTSFKNEPLLESKGIKFNNLISADLNGAIFTSAIAFDPKAIKKNELFNVPKTLYSSGDSILFFSEPYHYTLYKVSKDMISPAYTISFSSDEQLPTDFLTNQKYFGQRRKYTSQNKDVVWSCSDVYLQNDRFLTFNLQSEKDLYKTFVYDLKTKKYIDMNNIYSQAEFNNLLPVMGNRIEASDNKFFYSYLTARDMFEVVKLTGLSKNINTNLPLKKFYEQSSNLGNPVLTRIRFKAI